MHVLAAWLLLQSANVFNILNDSSCASTRRSGACLTLTTCGVLPANSAYSISPSVAGLPVNGRMLLGLSSTACQGPLVSRIHPRTKDQSRVRPCRRRRRGLPKESTQSSSSFGPSMNPSSETCSAAMIFRMTVSLERLWGPVLFFSDGPRSAVGARTRHRAAIDNTGNGRRQTASMMISAVHRSSCVAADSWPGPVFLIRVTNDAVNQQAVLNELATFPTSQRPKGPGSPLLAASGQHDPGQGKWVAHEAKGTGCRDQRPCFTAKASGARGPCNRGRPRQNAVPGRPPRAQQRRSES